MTSGKYYNARLFLNWQLVLSRILLSLLTMTLITACGSPTPQPTPTAIPLANRSQEEAIANIRPGKSMTW
ncbi:hypothetical protein [Candidatus Villigracilis saccharophilus]|uniref:hypothetical protein n=1 Tax=Candidatus Villigracilis saccharophilus TaxID=3140684 RepID=UPI003134D900|nr:hypothetical protein [Anaerolineales bacterium]